MTVAILCDKEAGDMKKWLAIIIAVLLAVGPMAMAEEPETAEATAQAEETAALETDGEVDPAESETPADTAAEAAADAAELPAPEEVETLTAEPVEVWFEEGFGLSLPADWVSYPVSEADQAAGVRYALGDGSGERFLFIQLTATSLQSAEALNEAVDAEESFSKRGALTFNGTEFTTFIDSDANASCCATLWGGKLLMFMFTPQSDADFMLTAPQIMETFVAH